MKLFGQNTNLSLKIALISFMFLFLWNNASKNKIEISLENDMVLVPGGKFFMGADHSESYLDEKPVHEVYVDSFLMDKYEVTNYQFREFVNATGYISTAEKIINWDKIRKQLPTKTSKPPDSLLEPGSLIFVSSNYPLPLNDETKWWKWKKGVSWRKPKGENSSIDSILNHPVVHVSWDDAFAYSKWVKKRLPTEAEWERAAKGKRINKIYPWGNESINQLPLKANFWQGHFPYLNSGIDGFMETAPVSSFPPNDYGLYDMSGNVWEWCSDFYNENSYRINKVNGLRINPRGPFEERSPSFASGQKKVLRGGSFLCNDSYCSGYRVSRRMSVSKDTGLSHTGFRCVKDL